MKDLNGIYSILLAKKVLSKSEVETCIDYEIRNTCSTIVAIKNSLKHINIDDIYMVLSEFYQMPYININNYLLDMMPEKLIDIPTMLKYKIIPLVEKEHEIIIGVSDPTNKKIQDDLKFKNLKTIQYFLVNEISLNYLFEHNAKNYFNNFEFDNELMNGIELEESKEDNNIDMVNSSEEDQPIVKFVHKVIYDAVLQGASDIHFEPYEKSYRVRYRVDGILKDIIAPPVSLKEKIAARIKVVSKLDISEKRIPQDGRLRLSISQNQIIDFRVSTLPTAFGEKIVLRILDRKSASLGIEALGFDPQQKQAIMDTIERPYGMALVTGPTGSGKTVTLYSCLGLLNDSNRNISTAEDPIEIPITGINQVAVNEKTGLNFGVALRAFLRQDPDVIMVGEIRDKDTAEMAIKAAQTGHLVLSTLHTNDAPSALTRLVSMGIPTYNVGDAILTIIAQRLVRKLCPKCKKTGKFDEEALLKMGFNIKEIKEGFQPNIPVGCEYCNFLGYKGRIGVFEVMPISDALKKLILKDATSVELAEQARKEGVLSLRQSGLNKVREGVTSITEVEANTNV